MKKVITAEQTLAFLLYNQEFVSYDSILRFKEYVEQRKTIQVNVNGLSLDDAILSHPDLFKRTEEGVMRSENAKVFFDSGYIDKHFLDQTNIPYRVRKVMDSVLEKMNL